MALLSKSHTSFESGVLSWSRGRMPGGIIKLSEPDSSCLETAETSRDVSVGALVTGVEVS